MCLLRSLCNGNTFLHILHTNWLSDVWIPVEHKGLPSIIIRIMKYDFAYVP